MPSSRPLQCVLKPLQQRSDRKLPPFFSNEEGHHPPARFTVQPLCVRLCFYRHSKLRQREDGHGIDKCTKGPSCRLPPTDKHLSSSQTGPSLTAAGIEAVFIPFSPFSNFSPKPQHCRERTDFPFYPLVSFINSEKNQMEIFAKSARLCIRCVRFRERFLPCE